MFRTTPQSLRLAALFVLGLLAAAPAIAAYEAYADPSGRVARLSHTQGDVSFAPAGEGQWYGIVRNRPLTRGDRLWTDRNGLAEIQVGSAAVRLGPQTSFEILDLHDGIGQFLVTQGTLSLTVRRLYPGQVYEVATPNLAVVINRAGRYRIDVDPHFDEATIVIWEGEANAYGDYGSFAIHRSEAVRFYGSDLRDYQLFRLPRADAFDRYGRDRDRILARSGSLRFVGDDVLGYAELDRYGNWQQVRSIGAVWFPSRVHSGWAPYSDGHWVWQEPWGWTWVDNAPWGFAPSHYGRWVNVSNRWGWVPGPRDVRPVYAPALVAFVGGSNWSLTVSSGGGAPIGWFPLGPRDVYVPPYQASRNYFTQVNVTNTVVNNTTVNNIYNNYYASGATNVTQVNYGNRNVAGAVTAVPGNVFTSAASVRQAAFQVDGDMLARSEVKRMATFAPSARSVAGAALEAKATPTRGAFERPVVARNAPPPAARSFAAREQQLQRTPGLAPPREVTAEEAGPAAAGALRRQAIATRNVRLVAEKAAEVDARAAAAAGQPDAPTGRAAAERTPPVLDRSVEPTERRGPPARGRDGTPATRRAEAGQDQPAEEARQERARQHEAQQQRQGRADQQKAQDDERARQAEAQQQRQRQAEEQKEQAAERVRQAEAQQAEAAERTRQAEAQQAQAAERARRAEAKQRRQRQADDQEQQAQAAERTRQAEAQEAQAAERARQATVQEAQAAERVRQAEAQEAQAERARQTQARQRSEAEKDDAGRAGPPAVTPAPVRSVPSKVAPPQRGERGAPVPRRDTRQQDEEDDEDEDSEGDDLPL